MEGSASGGSSENVKQGRRETLLERLDAPLIVTLVGAVFAGLLISPIASRVEDHRKARELQTALVQRMPA